MDDCLTPIMADPTKFHYMELIPPTNKNRRPRRKCRLCYRNKRRRETAYICAACPDKPSLCVRNCFRLYHEEIFRKGGFLRHSKNKSQKYG
ncbi:piggyBac transposable element-derived protein 4-like [Hermetia illucens]|uniref:piggyBac transposable element-derived protein 4-like n=1 Tax=Hermetia illucens TaxID=343691 RepID=UPI0018CC552C|nr:piggyBac transposable element-derived protein 4-like [Hermetia illucens]